MSDSNMQTIQANPPLAAITKLFDSLNAQGVRYCHWKSNCNLDRSLRGLTDLDLLVDPSHGERFRLILHQHDIKPIVSPPDKQYPAIEDYLGFDPDTGRQYHLHVHYQLVLGEQFVKNYHLPLEEAFLDHVQTYQGLVKIPSPELELVVLTARALLKYRDRDLVKDILSIRSPGLPSEMLQEFKYLLDQTDQARISNTLKSQVDFISPEIVLELLTTLVHSPRSGRVLYRLRKNLRRELFAYQRYSRWTAIRQYWRKSLSQWLPFLGSGSSKKIPATGGRVVAVIGADGAGKSTVLQDLHKWLAWKLKVRRHYMGSQQPSLVTQLLYTLYRMMRKAHRIWSSVVGEKRISSSLLRWLQSLSRNVYHLSVGQDRYHRYISSRQQAAQGAIVLCDRYPLAAICSVMEGRPMDGPQIAVESGQEMDKLTRALSRMEQEIYRKIRPPDHIFVLHVSPEVSQRRKPDHDPEMIQAKSQALKQMDRQGLHILDVDADQPYEQVSLQIKTALWQLL
jgi:thymidylate kinase